MFCCIAWEEQRAEILRQVGEILAGKMLQIADDWKKINDSMTQIMKKNDDDERVHQAHPLEQVDVPPRIMHW